MQNQIIIYQPEVGLSSLEVRLENETVWLSLDQIANLFERDKSTVSRHIKNIFKENELEKNSVIANFATTAADGKTYSVDYYNLDVIISVGYRVKSKRGIQFRTWANSVLKEYLLRGHAFQVRLEKVENDVGELKSRMNEIAFQVKTELSPKEGVFLDGQVFDAYELVISIIKEAKKSIVLIDNYVDETVLSMLSKRKDQVKATIYTANLSKELSLDLKKHNAQYAPVEIKVFTKSHDRFLIIDEEAVYHIGGSLKDLGKKLFAFSRIEIDPQIILNYLLDY
ncbi:MAG TPA: RhuM family protein [bacterium]|nr:RhuM family protein [bacterium]HQJ60818.1 RhuM family protein [bacterium]